MSEAEVLYINDMPLTDLGLHVTDHPGWMTSAELGFPYAPIPNTYGGILSSEATTNPPAVSVTARADASSLTNRETVINAVQRRLHGLLELRYADQPDKVLDAVCHVTEVTPASRLSFIEPDIVVALNFTAPFGYRRDRWPRIASFGATRTEIPLGEDVPSGGKIFVMGAATNPTITYRASSGEAVQTMGFTITLAADDFLEIDLDKRTIVKSVSGTRTTDNTLRTNGYFFNPDPGHGSPEWSDWPTLEVDAGSGLYLYERNWRI